MQASSGQPLPVRRPHGDLCRTAWGGKQIEVYGQSRSYYWKQNYDALGRIIKKELYLTQPNYRQVDRSVQGEESESYTNLWGSSPRERTEKQNRGGTKQNRFGYNTK